MAWDSPNNGKNASNVVYTKRKMFQSEIKSQQDRAKEAVSEFVQGAVTGSPERMMACWDEIEMGISEPGGGWVGVMRAVSRQPSVPRVTREFFLRVFIKCGDHLRQE